MEQAIWAADAWELADQVREGQLKAVEILDTALERIGRFDGDLNSFVLIDPEGARSQAESIDLRVAAGEDPGMLAGIPTGVKDLQDAAGLPTGRGSLLFGEEPAPRDCTMVSRLRNAGAVIVGKTTSPELGTLMYTWNKATGTTRNPWNRKRTPGGSSGGSAAAVAAGLVPLATASDGGGSIRIPASYSGLPGLKPTFGLVPRGPGKLGGANLSAHGPMARSMRTIARYLDQTAGIHPADPYSLPSPTASFEKALERPPPKGLKVVWSEDLGFGECDSEIAKIVRIAAGRLIEAIGAHEVSVPVDLPDVGASWMLAEALDCYADLKAFWPERGDDMTPVVALSMQMAESLAPEQYAGAVRERQEVVSRVGAIFEQVDLLMTPTTPTAAFEAEGPIPYEINGKPLANPLLSVCFTFPFNLTGNPAVTVPAGVNSEGLPVGLQLVGPRLSEELLLRCAGVFEHLEAWPKLAPAYT